ncbi:hypothetical protein DL546_002381 [Coniochaeta pulveracea]|uniref:Uncharacterized protein n=1 Tax=Coniochaeta pulveracea TaxID=177199 RepID=A0A420Y9K2_9PEZI|nr:hypothetical protein DL546_002381 [Coniochaeta pulveracea]
MAERDVSALDDIRARRTGKELEKTKVTQQDDEEDGHLESKDPPLGGHRPHHKPKPGGTFLLSDPLERTSPSKNLSARRRSRLSLTPTSTSHTPERTSHPNELHSDGRRTATPEPSSRRSEKSTDVTSDITLTNRNSYTDTTSATSPDASHRSSMASLDLDSTQIVNMALNLSESRRLASRRNVSQPLPPRLAPLPDTTAGGSLGQHLQQQRRISRNISPKPGALARSGTGVKDKLNSPMQSNSESEGGYRYHFSPSTLSRAQKAKDYLELQSLYRKVLDFLPPLTPPQSRRSSTASPPGSPNALYPTSTTGSLDFSRLGRAYNPLQYIRNRKVRARERKAIDGQTQGFNDSARVQNWVDEAAKNVASGHVTAAGTLPIFNTPQEANDASETGTQLVPVLSKPKRPRVDWTIDPADMLADAYWLEQGDNKKLVEDRHWRRVFPQNSSIYRPQSRQTEDGKLAPPPLILPEAGQQRSENDPAGVERKQAKSEPDGTHGSARERAQQKLQVLKGLHHRKNSSIQHRHRDFIYGRRASLSESSDNDSDRKARTRQGTIGSDGKEIMEKQMMEMIAQEEREKELEAQRGYEESRRQRSLTLESEVTQGSNAVQSVVPSRAPSHRRSKSEWNVADKNQEAMASQATSPRQPGRASLEVPPNGKRLSIDLGITSPGSPNVRQGRGMGLVPAIGRDLSPSPTPHRNIDRSTSPSRNPLSMVKSMFRDRSRERNTDSYGSAMGSHRGHGGELVLSPELEAIDPMSTEKSRRRSSEKRSRSPVRKIISKGTDTSNKSPRNHGSLKLRRDESSSGLRSLLKGPKLDTVIRSGVSKVGGLIWGKEVDGHSAHLRTHTASPSDRDKEDSSDESDVGLDRGRTRDSEAAAQPADQRTYLDVMPAFVPTTRPASQEDGGQPSLSAPHPSSRPPSRRSSRFELLKPPRIDIQDAPSKSPSPEPQGALSRQLSEVPDVADGVRSANADLDAASTRPETQYLASDQSSTKQRQWSISDGRRPSAVFDTRTELVQAPVSRAEIARLRALVLSSGIMAAEIDRRAKEKRLRTGTSPASAPARSQSDNETTAASALIGPPTWTSIASLHPDPETRSCLLATPLSQFDLYPTAARTLASAIEQAGSSWQSSADQFASVTAPSLRKKVEDARTTVAGKLSDLTRRAADEADEATPLIH